MALAADVHYRAYKPAAFTKQDIANVEILFGGLHWRAERLLQAVFENLGYRARILPQATRADLSTGRELADIGQCCSTSFTTGNLANFLTQESERIGARAVSEKYVYVTAGSCGACRFGQYHESYSLALRNLGLESFRLFLIDQNKPGNTAAQESALEINMPLMLGIVWGLLCADVVQGLEYRTRPYEVRAGQTDEIVRECIDHLYEVFLRRPHKGMKWGKKWGSVTWHFATNYFVNALRDVFKKFAAIEVDRLQPKPVVKITGEFYLQTVEGEPNYNIHRWLESEGAEVIPAPVAVWIDYLIRFQIQTFEDYAGVERYARAKAAGLRVIQRLYRWNYDRLRAALGDIPLEMPDQYELHRLAAPYFHHRLSGGEGDMLVGKALWAHRHRKAHMICELSPYACMPNTMSIGAMAGVLGTHPDLLYAPIEVKGDAEVHALSRCQMILTEAKKRAIQEYEAAAGLSGLTPETARRLLGGRARINRATYRMPHHGAAGMAANTLLHLAGKEMPASPAGAKTGDQTGDQTGDRTVAA
jgi:predicted nucleotide-binding protein (sugar kinase/HSP70/actin superfamily)